VEGIPVTAYRTKEEVEGGRGGGRGGGGEGFADVTDDEDGRGREAAEELVDLKEGGREEGRASE